MKWMWNTALLVLMVAATVSAQSGGNMHAPAMGDSMKMSYTGCVAKGDAAGSFLLTHVADSHEAMMAHDGMMKDGTMKDGAAMKDASAGTIALTGQADLKTHVGQKVTVTGAVSHGMSDAMPNGRDTLAIASLKVLAKSCS